MRDREAFDYETVVPMESKTLVTTTPDYGDDIVLLPVEVIADVRNSVDDEGGPLRVEEAVLDELDDVLVTALVDAGLAHVDERLGSLEVLVIPEAGRANVMALCQSMGYLISHK